MAGNFNNEIKIFKVVEVEVPLNRIKCFHECSLGLVLSLF